jgi:predicted site-specific integrase-resolvase
MGMDKKLLKPNEVDLLLRYPLGRTAKLAKAGRIPFICLPDGAIRVDEAEIERILNRPSKVVGDE